eukprot:2189760-Pleurochrysis_carterae.AAC.5
MAAVLSGVGARMAPWPKQSVVRGTTPVKCARVITACLFRACDTRRGSDCARVAPAAAAAGDKHSEAVVLSDGGARAAPQKALQRQDDFGGARLAERRSGRSVDRYTAYLLRGAIVVVTRRRLW